MIVGKKLDDLARNSSIEDVKRKENLKKKRERK